MYLVLSSLCRESMNDRTHVNLNLWLHVLPGVFAFYVNGAKAGSMADVLPPPDSISHTSDKAILAIVLVHVNASKPCSTYIS